MKVQVICGTRLGATREIADRIAHRLARAGLDARSLAPEDLAEEPGADAYVRGSGVYAGHWQKALATFALHHAAKLRQRPVWLDRWADEIASSLLGTSAARDVAV